jgi:hypothetical protein
VAGTENCTKASQYIYDEFQAMGLPVEFHNWNFNKITDRDVVATLPGTDTSSNATYLICAHHDTELKGVSPGAIDNGCSVAAVLAIAKILSQYTFNYTIQFISFSGEEPGLFGSYLYAREASRRNDNIIGVINMEAIGFADTTEGGRTIVFLIPERSTWLGDFANTVSLLYRNQTHLTVELSPGAIDQDHRSFVDFGFDGICAYPYDDPYFEGWLHTQYDSIDKINWTYFTKSTKLVLAVIAELAKTPLELQVIINKPNQEYFYFFNLPLFPLNFWKNNYHGFRGRTFIIGSTDLNVDLIPYNNVKYVIFCIDGNFVDFRIVTAPHCGWKIHNWLNYPLFGQHRVELFAYTTSGNIAYDEINIFIFQPFFFD